MRKSILAFLAAGAVAASAGSASAAGTGVELGGLTLTGGLRIAGGLDTNVFLEAEEEDSSMTLRLAPRFGLANRDKQMVDASIAANFVFEQFLDSEANVSDQSGLTLAASAGVRLFPEADVSLAISDSIRRAVLPNPDGDETDDAEPFRTLTNDLGAEVAYHPGGRSQRDRSGLSGNLGVNWRRMIFETLEGSDRSVLSGRLALRYNFLPRTGVFVRASVGATSYDDAGRPTGQTEGGEAVLVPNVDSIAVRVSGGASGMVTNDLSLLGRVGVGLMSYDDDGREDQTAFIAQLRLSYAFTRTLRAGIGYDRDVADLSGGTVALDTFGADLSAAFGDLSLRLDASMRRADFLSFDNPTIQGLGGAPVGLYSEDERVDWLTRVGLQVGYAFLERFSAGVNYGLRLNASNVERQDRLFREDATNRSFDYTQHRVLVFFDAAL